MELITFESKQQKAEQEVDSQKEALVAKAAEFLRDSMAANPPMRFLLITECSDGSRNHYECNVSPDFICVAAQVANVVAANKLFSKQF